jgi:hypothetical protein
MPRRAPPEQQVVPQSLILEHASTSFGPQLGEGLASGCSCQWCCSPDLYSVAIRLGKHCDRCDALLCKLDNKLPAICRLTPPQLPARPPPLTPPHHPPPPPPAVSSEVGSRGFGSLATPFGGEPNSRHPSLNSLVPELSAARHQCGGICPAPTPRAINIAEFVCIWVCGPSLEDLMYGIECV